jgi:hypothetical protein
MKRKLEKGGKRPGAGTIYAPWNRIRLAHRYAELKWQFHEMRSPGKRAYSLLHTEEHPDGGGSITTTKRLVIAGGHDDNFLADLDAKRHNREPLSKEEQLILRKWSRRWARWARRHRQR